MIPLNIINVYSCGNLNPDNLLHSTRAREHYYPQPVSRFLLLSSLAFDSSVAGIFWTLLSGGALVLPGLYHLALQQRKAALQSLQVDDAAAGAATRQFNQHSLWGGLADGWMNEYVVDFMQV